MGYKSFEVDELGHLLTDAGMAPMIKELWRNYRKYPVTQTISKEEREQLKKRSVATLRLEEKDEC